MHSQLYLRRSKLFSLALSAIIFAFSPSAFSSGGGGGGGTGNYKEISPPFVVNLADTRQSRLMQVTVAVESPDEEVRKAIDTHAPLIRNNLIMLFAAQSKDVVKTKEGREKLRMDAQEVVNKALKDVGVSPVDALYFTGLVVQ